MTSSSDRDKRECLLFLRQLGDHVAAARTGLAIPHAGSCLPCSERLRLACQLGGWIAQAPPTPEDLRSPSALDAIMERIVLASEQSPVGQSILPHLVRVPVPDTLPWPGQAASREVQRYLVEPSGSAPSWLWRHVREQVLAERALAARGFSLSRRIAWLGVAAVLLFALLGIDLARHQEANSQPEIVFVPVTEMPLIQHAAVVLRLGGGR